MTVITWILLAYFLLMTGIGIYSFFRVKSISDYYISGKQGNLWQITGTLFATIIGGSAILGTVELSQKAGWAAVWFLTSASAGLFVLAIIAPKVSRLGHYTLPEMIRNFYGRRAERTAAFMIPFAWLGIIAVQIIAGAKVLSGLGIMSYSGSAWLCGVVFTLYTLLGGQKSILKSDFVQALIILAGVVVLFVLRRKACAGDNFPQLSPSTLFNEDFSAMDLFFLLVTYSVTFVVGPDIYSRIFCARDGKVARKSVILTALLIIPVAYMLTFLGITAGNDIPPANENGFILPGTSFLPPWALGLLVAALLSAVMSSADTTLLTSSLILAELVTGNLDKKESFNTTRVIIPVMGCLSILIALKVTSILNAFLISLSFFSGAFIIPVISGIAGWKVNRHLAYAAIITGGITTLAGKIVSNTVPGNGGNLLILLGFGLNAFLLLIPFTQKSKKKSLPHKYFNL
jgi:SSS family solute:Na+ symporter